MEQADDSNEETSPPLKAKPNKVSIVVSQPGGLVNNLELQTAAEGAISGSVFVPGEESGVITSSNNLTLIVPVVKSTNQTTPNGSTADTSVSQNVRLTIHGKRVGRPPGTFKQRQNNNTNSGNNGEEFDVEATSDLPCRWRDCTMKFTTVKGLDDHVQEEHVQSTKQERHAWRCEWEGCNRNKTFKACYLLAGHVRSHTGEKPNKCEYPGCGKEYIRFENLKTHHRTHTGEKPYKCEFADCEKAFNTASDRTKHQNFTHSDSKPYGCQILGCDKSYTDPSSLRSHIKKVHGDEEHEKAKKSRPTNYSNRRCPDARMAPTTEALSHPYLTPAHSMTSTLAPHHSVHQHNLTKNVLMIDPASAVQVSQAHQAHMLQSHMIKHAHMQAAAQMQAHTMQQAQAAVVLRNNTLLAQGLLSPFTPMSPLLPPRAPTNVMALLQQQHHNQQATPPTPTMMHMTPHTFMTPITPIVSSSGLIFNMPNIVVPTPTCDPIRIESVAPISVASNSVAPSAQGPQFNVFNEYMQLAGKEDKDIKGVDEDEEDISDDKEDEQPHLAQATTYSPPHNGGRSSDQNGGSGSRSFRLSDSSGSGTLEIAGSATQNGSSTSGSGERGKRSFSIADILQLACDFKNERFLGHDLNLSIFDTRGLRVFYRIYQVYQRASIVMQVIGSPQRLLSLQEVQLLHSFYHHPLYNRAVHHHTPDVRNCDTLFWRVINWVNRTGARQLRASSMDDEEDEGYFDEMMSMMNQVVRVENGRLHWNGELDISDSEDDEDDFVDEIAGLRFGVQGGLNVQVAHRRRRRARRQDIKQAYIEMDEDVADVHIGLDGGFGGEGNRNEEGSFLEQTVTQAFVDIRKAREKEAIEIDHEYDSAFDEEIHQYLAGKRELSPQTNRGFLVLEEKELEMLTEQDIPESSSRPNSQSGRSNRYKVHRLLLEEPEMRESLPQFATIFVDKEEIRQNIGSSEYVDGPVSEENELRAQHRSAVGGLNEFDQVMNFEETESNQQSTINVHSTVIPQEMMIEHQSVSSFCLWFPEDEPISAVPNEHYALPSPSYSRRCQQDPGDGSEDISEEKKHKF